MKPTNLFLHQSTGPLSNTQVGIFSLIFCLIFIHGMRNSLTYSQVTHVDTTSDWIQRINPETCHHKIDSLYRIGVYNKALDLIVELQQYYQATHNLCGEILCYNYFGDLHRAVGDPATGVNYLKISLLLNKELQDSSLLAKTFNLLAACYLEYLIPFHYDSSQHYARLSMDIVRSQKDEKIQSSSANILGILSLTKKNYREALAYFDTALMYVQQVHDIDESLINLNISRVHQAIGNLKESERLATSAFQLAKANHIPVYIWLSADFLRNFYVAQGDTQKVNYFLNELTSAKAIVLHEKAEKRIRDLETNIRIVRTEQENEKLKLEDTINKKKLAQRRLNSVFLTVLVLCLLIFSVVFARQKKRLREINKSLQQVNDELSKQNETMAMITQELENSNATLKKFISVMAHDLKNPFNAIIGFSDLLRYNYQSLTQEDKKLAIENTNKSAVNAYTLLEQLLEWARLQTGSIQLTGTEFNLSELIEEVVGLLQTSAFLKKQQINLDISREIIMHTDQNILRVVLRNLISNAIKFTPEHGSIRIEAGNVDGLVQIRILDTGVGISSDALKFIFHLDNPVKTNGTAGEKGTGIGLLLVRDYIEKLKGTIHVESTVNVGTTFTIRLPIK